MRFSKMNGSLLCRLLLLWVLTDLLFGCAGLPKLTPAPGESSIEWETVCLRFFPQSPWRAVHALHISGPFGQRSSVMGVTVVDPTTRRIRAVILSVEGIVLFDASREAGTTTVHRAVPSLDHKGFPEGLMHDVDLMFLAPEGGPAETGQNSEGNPVCRWRSESGTTTDVAGTGETNQRILQYDPDNTLRREVEMEGETGAFLAGRARLSFHGLVGYGLDLNLIEFEALAGDPEALFSP
jgi:hypothetical protein